MWLVPAERDNCKTEVERLLYLIKNMHKLNKYSKPYPEGDYREIFEAAESENLVAEDMVLYSKSLERLNSMRARIDYVAEQALLQGIEKGMEKGREEEKYLRLPT